MNTRKFIYIISICVGSFLFILGAILLLYVNNAKVSPGVQGGLSKMFSGIVSDDKPMNFLVMIGDKSSGNTDTMIVVNYNPGTKQINLLTIPRDTKVKLKNHILPKINAAFAAGGRKQEGCAYASQVVSDLTGVNINYYAHVDISCVREITDMLGGVNFDVPTDMKYNDPTQNLHIDLKKGYQLLNGDKVEQLLRFRKPSGKYTTELKQYYDGSDIKRTEMQLKFLKEFMNQKLTIKYLPQYNSVISYAFSNIITNMTLNDTLQLAKGLINFSSKNLSTFRLDGEDKIISGGWYYVYNGNIINVETKESLPASQIISQYFNSESGMIKPSGDSTIQTEEPAEPSTSTPVKKIKKNPSNSKTNMKVKNKESE
jgi:LCP family protein required for cell wall assembly